MRESNLWIYVYLYTIDTFETCELYLAIYPIYLYEFIVHEIFYAKFLETLQKSSFFYAEVTSSMSISIFSSKFEDIFFLFDEF